MKRRAFAVALPVAGFLLVACGPAPLPVEVVDLVSEFRYAEVEGERPLIDLGTPPWNRRVIWNSRGRASRLVVAAG